MSWGRPYWSPSPILVPNQPLWLPTQAWRVGEAKHPGPREYSEAIPHYTDKLCISQSNAGSLRQRADLVSSLGPGIHCFSETHLTKHTYSTFKKQLNALARQQHRRQMTIPGCHVPTRSPGQEAGLWSGVLQVTDHFAQRVQLPWPPDHWETGRVLITQHAIGHLPLQIATIYGFAVGPTWPKAATLTNQLLTSITNQLVLGSSGPRIITGDFNQSKQLEQQSLWASQGWVEAQQYAQQHLHHTPQPTNGENSFVDQIWLSPEAAALVQHINVLPVFKGHCTIFLHLHCPSKPMKYYCWPRPAKLPWDSLQQHYDDGHIPLPQLQQTTSTKAYADWAKTIEDSFIHTAHTQNITLPPNCTGRGQRTTPQVRSAHKPSCRPPREGELQLQYSLIGTAVRHWYIQARRLQSLVHSVRSSSSSPHKHVYQVEVWTAILRAKGFHPNFRTWWDSKTHILPESAFQLRHGVPPLDELLTINDEYIKHFRAFETWHLRQRTERYELLHQHSLQQLYKELRKPKPNSVEGLYQDHDYEVMAIQEEEFQLDRAPSECTHQHWFTEEGLLPIGPFNDDISTTTAPLEVGQIVTQRKFEISVEGISDLFVQHWRDKWTAINELSSERLGKVLDFANAFLPPLSFELKPLTIGHWRAALKRMKVKAATGADGISRADLLALSDRHLQWLVDMFNALETSQTHWPEQLLTGLAFTVAKIDLPHLPEHFRPIHLFTIAHRIWGSIRARQLLRRLAPYVPDDLHGYLPDHEPAMLWFTLQAWIETGLSSRTNRHGASADLLKCFNCIEREPYFALSERLGTPRRLTLPWRAFLAGFNRRFQIHHALSEAVHSTRGFPEGCPLSVLTMVHIGWAFHIWLKFFHPTVDCSTYVDNLDFHSSEASQQWFSIWGLSIDTKKTFHWSTDPMERARLQAQGMACLTDVKELGGAMTFCRAIRNRELKHRATALHSKWEVLHRSRAPLLHKLKSLALVCWPIALHGAAACTIATGHFHDLRKQAVKALRLNGAGSNATLRLTLYDDPLQDPEFFHLRSSLLTFRRMLRKNEDIIHLWRIAFRCYDGKLLPGPFSKLLQLFSIIGWSVYFPPMLYDHVGIAFNLRTVDKTWLLLQLQDAWFQVVATRTKHKTMDGLYGLNHYLSKLDRHKLDGQQRARVSALQSGAFLSNAEHGRYDSHKDRSCSICSCVDDRLHWHSCPRFAELRASQNFRAEDFADLPRCFVFHLLPPQIGLERTWRVWLANQPDQVKNFESVEITGDIQHLFTDGACSRHHPVVSLAAWAVISASSGHILATGPLAGPKQTAARAEITGLLSALHWSVLTDTDVCLWTDASNAAETLQGLIAQPDNLPPEVDSDLWLEVQATLSCRTHRTTLVRWVPSHLEPSKLSNCFEEWVQCWNRKADETAVRSNQDRDQFTLGLRDALVSKYKEQQTLLERLRDFYLAVADITFQQDDQVLVDMSAPPEDELSVADSLTECLPVSWLAQISGLTLSTGIQFAINLFEQLFEWEGNPGHLGWFTDLEVVFLLADEDFAFPGDSDPLTLRSFSSFFAPPPATRLLSLVTHVLDEVLATLDLSVFRRVGYCKPELGIHLGGGATLLCLPAVQVARARCLVENFTKRRAVRSRQDLSRPLSFV